MAQGKATRVLRERATARDTICGRSYVRISDPAQSHSTRKRRRLQVAGMLMGKGAGDWNLPLDSVAEQAELCLKSAAEMAV